MPYFYEHTNGEIIKKPQIVVQMAGGPDEYFNSPFVKRWWFQADSKAPRKTTAEVDGGP